MFPSPLTTRLTRQVTSCIDLLPTFPTAWLLLVVVVRRGGGGSVVDLFSIIFIVRYSPDLVNKLNFIL